MIVPVQVIKICKKFEGFHRKVRQGIEITAVPYVCPAGFWTIGYGHLCTKNWLPITEAEGEILLAMDLQNALYHTIRLCPVLIYEDEDKLSALVDFTFNLGATRLAASTLRKRVNARDWDDAATEIKKWVWGGGRKLPGLILRREVEASLICK